MNTILRLAETRRSLSVVDDQIGSPTYAGHLSQAAIIAAETLGSLIQPESGTYHVSGSGITASWASFATNIFSEARNLMKHDVTVLPIKTSEFPTPAPRPAYSVMDFTQFEQRFNFILPT